MSDAVVLVSGGAAVTPFTDPDRAAAEGLAAGNTLTALRAHLHARGTPVFTAPARLGVGEVRDDPGWQGFSGAPVILPAELTINAVGEIDKAGTTLAAFVRWLADEYELGSVDFVGHSMGGLFSRSAIRELQLDGPAVRHLVTLGTPWDGSLLGDVLTDEITLDDAHEDPATTEILQRSRTYAAENSQGAADQVSRKFLREWNSAQTGVLDDVAVTALGAGHFHAASAPRQLWPHDGLVSQQSARADDVSPEVLPRVARHTLGDDVHSIFFADAFGLPWERAITWDPRVFEIVDGSLRN